MGVKLLTHNNCSIHFGSAYPQPSLESKNLARYLLNTCLSVSGGPGSVPGGGDLKVNKTCSLPSRSSYSRRKKGRREWEKNKHTSTLASEVLK